MKKMNMFIGLMFTGLFFIASSCGSSSSDSPGDAAMKMMTNIEKGNFSAIMENLETGDNEMDEDSEAKLNALLEASKKEIEKKGGIKSMELIEEKINEEGTEATVEIKTIYGNDEEDNGTSHLVKIDGTWKFKLK